MTATKAKSAEKARVLVARCNRQREQIDALEVRLYKLREKHGETLHAAFAALPEDYVISLGPNEPWEVLGPR